MRDVPAHRRAVIAGIGHTEFSQHSGRSPLQLASEASLAAIKDAGLSPADIDVLLDDKVVKQATLTQERSL